MLARQIERAEDFIWCNARLLERARFAFHFRDGRREAVVQAVLAYRNQDGGFGNALEPDKRDPHSQPVDVQTAFEILDEIDALEPSIAEPACEFLHSITTNEGGVPFALPSINAYPHAPWWTVNEEAPPASLNPTAAIVGLLWKNEIRHGWIEPAAAYCWRAIGSSQTSEYHTLMPMIEFLTHARDTNRAQRELERIAARIAMPGAVETDPAATGYLHKPLDWAPSPESFCNRHFERALIEQHLEALASRQQPDGGWAISWQPISPAVECEWRAIVTINALKTLRAYGWP